MMTIWKITLVMMIETLFILLNLNDPYDNKVTVTSAKRPTIKLLSGIDVASQCKNVNNNCTLVALVEDPITTRCFPDDHTNN